MITDTTAAMYPTYSGYGLAGSGVLVVLDMMVNIVVNVVMVVEVILESVVNVVMVVEGIFESVCAAKEPAAVNER